MNTIPNAADITPLIAVLQHMTRQTRKCCSRFILELGGATAGGNLAAATLAAAEASAPDPSLLVRKSSPARPARPGEVSGEGEESRPATRCLCLLSQ